MHPCSDSTPLKVLVLESISSTAVEEFKAAGFQVDEIHHLSEDQLVEKLPSYAIVGVRSKTKLTPRVLRAAELLAIGCFCIGTDQTDLVVAAENAVPVFNAPFANTRSVAEVVLAHIISLSRRIPDDIRNMHAGIWKKSATNKHEVRGLKLGIVGYGHVGSQLSVLAEAFGMDVRFFDIIPKLPLGNATPISTLDELLSTSDVVTLHVPFTDRTAGMIGEREIATMKDGAFLINYARGKCCDVPRVAEALRSGKLGGAAFDVFPSEPSSKDVEFKSELRGCPNTILTPHIGGSTVEAQALIGAEVAQKLISFAKTGSTIGSVNFPEVDLPLSHNEAVHRIVNAHANVPGVLRDINSVLAQYNISAQVLSTKGPIGYFMCHLDADISAEARKQIAALPHSIRTRVLE